MSALDSDQSFMFTLLQSVGVGDLNADAATARGGRLGQHFFVNDAFGLRLYAYVQNRHTAAVVKGALLSAVGDNDGKTQVTTSGGASANSKVKLTTSSLTANAHVGGGAYILNNTTGTGTAPEGEDGIIVSNSATEVLLDPAHPLSAVIASGDTVNLHGIANAQLSAAGDLAYAVLGVVAGKDGISAANFGFVARSGYCPNVLIKAATALTQNDALIADVGRAGPAVGGSSTGNLHIGTAPHVLNDDSVTDKTSAWLILGLGISPGTTDVSA